MVNKGVVSRQVYMQSWYMANQVRINMMTFKEYINELRNVWLPSEWEALTRSQVLASQQGGKPFWEWAIEMQGTNALLMGTQSQLSEAALRNQLKAGQHPDLSNSRGGSLK